MEENNSLSQKQQYLREEILDKSYDVDEFGEFMSKYKENGTDLKNWEFIELKDAVNAFKNKVNEEEGEKIEKGVEKIRQSYRFDEDENKNKNLDELDNNLQIMNNNINDNNCVNNILNDYLKNKENEKNDNNFKSEEKKYESNLGADNNLNQNLNEKNKIINHNENNNNLINSNETNIKYPEFVNSKEESEKNNIRTLKNNQNENDYNSQQNNNIRFLFQNKINNINNHLGENNINCQNKINNDNNIISDKINTNENKKTEFEDFEILENYNVNNKVIEKIKCVKQPENSLTKKDNLYVNLEA